MATKYTLHFSDTGKTPFDLQSYTTNGPVSPSDPSPIAGSSGNIETTLKLYGRGNKHYGEPVFQDLIYLLENFSNITRPVFSIEGQMWYNNRTFVVGSPPIQSELFIRNANADDTYGGSPFISVGWDAIILATGSSAMTAELILSGNPSNPLAAAPKQYIDLHVASTNLHLSADQDTFLDGLNLPSLTSTHVNFVEGVTNNIQTQLDDKLSRSVNENMDLNINLTFNGGEPLGLPTVPTSFDAAASRQYVDDKSTAAGDGVLTSTTWLNTGLGSPLPIPFENTLRLTVTLPGSPPTQATFDAQGITREGHIHIAADTPIDNSFDITYGANTQTAIERAATEIDLLKTGGIPPSATITVQRIFKILSTPLTVAGSPIDTFTTQSHLADDNRVIININGIKQYTHTRGAQEITYSTAVEDSTPTGLNSDTTYEFNIAIDGAAATTITINEGSPATDISTHAALVTAINAQLTGSPTSQAEFSINSPTSENFTTYSSGTGSSIAITDPGGSPNVYLFTGGSPLGLDGFVEVATTITGLEGEYMETDSDGVQILPGNFTSHVVFNYDIITGSKIESLLYV